METNIVKNELIRKIEKLHITDMGIVKIKNFRNE